MASGEAATSGGSVRRWSTCWRCSQAGKAQQALVDAARQLRQQERVTTARFLPSSLPVGTGSSAATFLGPSPCRAALRAAAPPAPPLRRYPAGNPAPLLLTAGGRVLGVTAVGADLRAAIATAYDAARRIQFDGMHYRRDIGRRALGEVRGL